jgi:hypothetical protein
MSDNDNVYPDFLPPPEDTEQQLIDKYESERNAATEQEDDFSDQTVTYEVPAPATPQVVYLSDEEIKERRSLLNYFAVAKSKFPTVWNNLNISDGTLDDFSVEQLRKLKIEYQQIRNHKNGFESFLLVAKNITLAVEAVSPFIGLDLEGFHAMLNDNPDYQDCLNCLAHDYGAQNVTPMQRLVMIVGLTGYQLHNINTTKKSTKIGTISDADTSIIDDF